MDFAAALALTAIFPALMSIIFWIAWMNYPGSADDVHAPIVDRRLWVTSIALGSLAMVIWIASIWCAFAQTAAAGG